MFYKALPRRASHRKKESNMQVYADNAATTKMSRTAIEAMLPYMDEIYGNPSSLHSVGQRAAEALQTARESIAADLNASPRSISPPAAARQTIRPSFPPPVSASARAKCTSFPPPLSITRCCTR